MAITITGGGFGQANQAAQFQMVFNNQRLQQLAALASQDNLSSSELADIAARSKSHRLAGPVQLDPSLSGDQAQAQAIYQQVKADSEGFNRLSNKYQNGDYHPKPKRSERKEFKRTKKLFDQLKAGKISPQELAQKLTQSQQPALQNR